MKTEQIGDYEVECSGVRLPDSEEWAAWLAINGPSPNPMHLNKVFPAQRVSADIAFASEQEAEAEARKVAISMIS